MIRSATRIAPSTRSAVASLAAAATALALVACSDDGGAHIGETGKKILAGDVDNGDPAVVAVLALDDKGQRGTCTGEVISDRVVLTAAHCVSPIPALNFFPNRFTVATGTDIRNTEGVAAARVVPHPGYVAATGVNDVAVVLMPSSLGIAPLAFNRDSLDGKDGAAIRIVGYGMTKDGDNTAVGVKNMADTVMTQIDAQHFLASSLPKTQCHGDSGGPALLDNVIVGIGWHTVRTDGLCDQGVTDTRVDIHAKWIDSQLLLLEGKQPPQQGQPAPSQDGDAGAPTTPDNPPTTPPTNPGTPDGGNDFGGNGFDPFGGNGFDPFGGNGFDPFGADGGLGDFFNH